MRLKRHNAMKLIEINMEIKFLFIQELQSLKIVHVSSSMFVSYILSLLQKKGSEKKTND